MTKQKDKSKKDRKAKGERLTKERKKEQKEKKERNGGDCKAMMKLLTLAWGFTGDVCVFCRGEREHLPGNLMELRLVSHSRLASQRERESLREIE